MDQKNLLLTIIAIELNTHNRLKISEQVELCKNDSYLNSLLAYSKAENQIANLLNTVMEGVIKSNE